MGKRDEDFDLDRYAPISRGGWFIDAAHKLPTKKPSAAALRAYATAQKKWEAKLKKADALTRKMEREAHRLGLVLSGDDYYPTVFPAGDEPMKPHDVEITKTPLDQAVQTYRNTGDVECLRLAQSLGAKVVYFFSGFSAGCFSPSKEEFLRDGPAIPDGVNVDGL